RRVTQVVRTKPEFAMTDSVVRRSRSAQKKTPVSVSRHGRCHRHAGLGYPTGKPSASGLLACFALLILLGRLLLVVGLLLVVLRLRCRPVLRLLLRLVLRLAIGVGHITRLAIATRMPFMPHLLVRRTVGAVGAIPIRIAVRAIVRVIGGRRRA